MPCPVFSGEKARAWPIASVPCDGLTAGSTEVSLLKTLLHYLHLPCNLSVLIACLQSTEQIKVTRALETQETHLLPVFSLILPI